MAMRPSIMGVLTEEEKQARDRHSMNLALFGNCLIENQEHEMQARSAKTAYKDPSFDGHQAMPAIVVQDHAIYHTQSTPSARRGGEEKISAFTQTEKIVMVEISTQTMVEMSTQTDEEEVLAVLSNFVPTQVEDRQEIMVAQSDEMIDPNQESTISIQTIPSSNEIGRTTIQQEGQLIMFADATSYGEDYQNQHQETLRTITGGSPIVNGEIDREEMPDLYFEESEEIMGWEAFKIDFLSNSDYSRAPGGPFKEEPTDDSSQSMFTMRMLAGQTELDESCVTHWQEPTMRARLKDRSRSEMRQEM
jgi:hypothetical protein